MFVLKSKKYIYIYIYMYIYIYIYIYTPNQSYKIMQKPCIFMIIVLKPGIARRIDLGTSQLEAGTRSG
jgi:hypothetical protein